MVPNPATYRIRNYKNVFDGGRKTLLCCIHPVSSQLAFTCSKSTRTMWNLFKVNNKDTRIKWRYSSVFIVNIEQISQIVLVFALLTLNKQIQDSIVCFELETGESSNWDHKNVWNLPLPWKHQKSIGFLNWFGQAPLILEAEFGDDFPVYSLFFLWTHRKWLCKI